MDKFMQIIAQDSWLLVPLAAMLIPILAILVGAIIAITKLVIKHRERIAMIERGILPADFVEHEADAEREAHVRADTYPA